MRYPAETMTKVMHQTFVAQRDAYPGEAWLRQFRARCPQTVTNTTAELHACQNALQQHMPELVPLWQHLCDLTGATLHQAMYLSHYCPPPATASGCSQCVWQRYSPLMVRNFEGHAGTCEGIVRHSRWHQTEVIAMSDGHWGVADGINEHGLIVSRVFGGHDGVAEGFGIALILRYVLEFCRTTQEAIQALCRFPSHMAYNVTLLDRQHRSATLELRPGGGAKILAQPFAVNHQGSFNLHNYTRVSRAFECQQTLMDQLHTPHNSVDSLIQAFAYAPLFMQDHKAGFGTLYTAVYNPEARCAEYRWPRHKTLRFSFAQFVEREWQVSY